MPDYLYTPLRRENKQANKSLIISFDFFLFTAIPIEEALKEGENILLVVTPYGGHLGFLEGLLPYDKGYDDRLMSEYVDAVFKYGVDEL